MITLTFTKPELNKLRSLRDVLNSKTSAAHRLKVAGSRFAALGTDHPALLVMARAEKETQRLHDASDYAGVAKWLEKQGHLEEALACLQEGRQNLELLKTAAIAQIGAIKKVCSELRALAYARANACLSRLEALADFLIFAPALLIVKEMPAIAIHRAANAPNQEKRSRALNGITQALALER